MFGEFLIEKGVINQSQLVGALIKQIKTMPSFAEAALESKALDERQLLEVISHQTRQKVGFIEAARSLGLWQPEVHKKIEDFISSKRVPVGQFLIEQGAITADNLSKMLDEFLGDLKEQDIRKPSAPVPAAESPPGNSEYITYVESFSESLRDETDNVMNFIGDPSQDAMLQSVLDSVHYLRGAARLVQASQSEKLMVALEEFLRKGQKNPGFQSQPSFLSHARDAWHLAWDLREAMASGGRELSGPSDSLNGKIEHVLKLLAE